MVVHLNYVQFVQTTRKVSKTEAEQTGAGVGPVVFVFLNKCWKIFMVWAQIPPLINNLLVEHYKFISATQ